MKINFRGIKTHCSLVGSASYNYSYSNLKFFGENTRITSLEMKNIHHGEKKYFFHVKLNQEIKLKLHTAIGDENALVI